MDEPARWAAQARFWAEVAKVCATSPAVFCYDLMNEPYFGSAVVQVILAAIHHDPALVLSGGLQAFLNRDVTSATSVLRDETGDVVARTVAVWKVGPER